MIRRHAIVYALYIAISSILGIAGFITTAGCKSQNKIQIVEPHLVVTNNIPAKAFNDEYYVWENFYFSTNQINDVKQK